MTKKKQPIKQLSPYEYIKTKARTFPISKCYINSDWIDMATANIVIARQKPSGNFILGVYCLEFLGKGLVIARAFTNMTQANIDEFLEKMAPKKLEVNMVVEIDYALAHNIIYGGIAFAKKNGFKINKDFEISKYILEEDDGKIEYIEIEFGKSEFREKEKEKVILERFKNIK